jgi:intracellular sulfur oxidation DsrE/DsrF family protein
LSSYAESETEHTVEVLANGEAVRAYVANTEEKMQSKMESLHQEGVLFTACNNALNGQNIPKESLLPFVKIVPAGVRELVDKQMDGFAYIKP